MLDNVHKITSRLPAEICSHIMYSLRHCIFVTVYLRRKTEGSFAELFSDDAQGNKAEDFIRSDFALVIW